MFSIGGVVSGFGTAAPQSGQYEKFRATSVLQQGHCFPPFIRIIAVFKRSISAYAFDTSVYFSSSSAFGKDARFSNIKAKFINNTFLCADLIVQV